MSHATKKNKKGQTITHTRAGRKKDPQTWEQLDKPVREKKQQKAAFADAEMAQVMAEALAQSRQQQAGGTGTLGFTWRRSGPTGALAGDSEADLQRKSLKALNDLRKTDPNTFKRIQQELLVRGYYERGFYGKTRRQVPFGALDPDTRQAFALLVDTATATGDLDELLFGPVSPEQQKALRGSLSGEDENEPMNPFDVENTAAQLQDVAAELGVPTSEQELKDWAFKIVQGKRARAIGTPTA